MAAWSFAYVPNSDVAADYRHRNISFDSVWNATTYTSTQAKYTPQMLGVTSLVQVENVIFGDRSATLGVYFPVWDSVNGVIRLFTATATEASGTVTATIRATFIIQP